MGAWSYIKGTFIATWAGFKHLFRPRMTLRYPEQKLDLQGPGYRYDAKQGVGLPGFKGRHLLRFEKCTGCQLCAIACDGVAVAIDMQKVQKGKPQNKKDIWPAVDYGRCVPPSTPIITLGGIKPMSEIRVGDEVLTHTGKFRKVTRLFGRTYAGKLYTFRTLGNFEPLTTTEDHPILTYGEGGVSWAFASEIKYRTYLTRPVISEEVPLSEIQFTYELYHPGGRGGTFTTELVALKSTPALMRLIGYYLAEGASDRYRVSFDIHKNEIDLKEDIIACVNEVFGANVSLKPDSDSQGLKIVVDSVRVASFFDQFGHHADLKNIPWWMTLLPKENIGEIVRAEFRGDGHYSDKYYKYKTAMHSNYFTTRTTSQTLALQVHFMLGRLGIVSSISTQKQKNRKLCYSVTVHSPYVEKMGDLVGVPAKNNEVSHSYVHLRDGMIMAPVIKIEVQEVKDFLVQNIEVEEDNSYVAANISVHNCVFCGLCVEPDTPVITNPGVKPLSDVTVGEMLLTHTGEYRPVTKIWDMMYTGPLYRIYAFGRPQPLVCTKDHRILAVSRPYGNRRDGRLARTFEPLLMTLPETLKAGDYLVSPIVKKTVKLNRYVADIPFGPRKKFKHLSLEATPDLFRLIGYYIAEGSCNSSAVSFSLHKKEKGIIEDISSLSRRYFGKSPSVAKATGDGVNVVLSSVVAVRFFSQFGRGAQNKKVSDWVFHSEKSKLLQLVKGIWLGDGCRVIQPRQKYINFRTSSRVLAFQEQSILARLGVVALIEQEDQEGRLRSYHVNVFGRWAIRLAEAWGVDLDYHPTKFVDKFHMTEDYVYLPIRKIERVEVVNHRVMDVTVEGVHTFAPMGIATSNCVDACPFDALDMTNDYELSAYDKMSLKYTPDMLAVPPKLEGRKYKVVFDTEKGVSKHA